MSEKTKLPQFKRQLDEISRSINRGPLIIFVTCLVGGLSLALSSYLFAAAYFSYSILAVGVTVFGVCTSLSMFLARQEKEQFKKLVEQLEVSP
ncbi:MAG: hypothetical protein NWE93_04750 [Candidatus Bathyarchaeota archaeon]|nr:hypothetical protein [Candidatus Bathyarchaeota archaeon]